MFGLMKISKAGIWDYTGLNSDYLDGLWDETAEAILCDKSGDR
jgi:hypothetical protein